MVGIDKSYDSGYFNIVRFFGDNAINPCDVKIKYLPGQFKLKDKHIDKFAKQIEKELKEQGRVYDGPLVTRVVTTQFKREDKELVVQKCSYGTFAGSCFALDKETKLFGIHQTLREYYINKDSNGIDEHPLALCLGICGILITKEKEKRQCLSLLLMQRSGNLASLENSIGPSAAGSVDFEEDYKNLSDLIERALGSEIEEELNLTSNEYKIIPLAYSQ